MTYQLLSASFAESQVGADDAERRRHKRAWWTVKSAAQPFDTALPVQHPPLPTLPAAEPRPQIECAPEPH